MFRNFLTVAIRNLQKQKTHSAINIGGLAIGMAVAILIGLWVIDELSFDKYHKHYNRIAQVLQKEQHLGKIKVWDDLPYLLVDAMQREMGESFSHIVAAMPSRHNLELSDQGQATGAIGPKKLPATGWYMDVGAAEMFTLKLRRGTSTVPANPYSIMLSASLAKALFGDAEPMGRTITLDNQWNPTDKAPVTVTGVYDDLPPNTRFHDMQYLLPWQYLVLSKGSMLQQGWHDHRIRIYAELNPDADARKLASSLAPLELNILKGLAGESEELAAGPQILLHPMSDWHLYSDFKEDIVDRGPVQFVRMMATIGTFVLVLACINFMILSTARSERKSREVGIRKAIGSLRGQLIRQFFVESYLIVLIALIPALALAGISLPWFNQLAAKQLTMPWTDPAFWALALAFVLIAGLLAGSYPALYLSSFSPLAALKGIFKTGTSAAILRKALVVLQFTLSVTLIIATVVVYKQIIFAKDRPIGYTRQGLMTVPITSKEFLEKYDFLRSRLKATGAVMEIAESNSALTNVSSNNGGFDWPGKPAGFQEDFGTLTVTYEYGRTIGWQFTGGRDFSPAYGTDSLGLVVNEAAVKYMGLAHPVGTIIHWRSEWLKLDTGYHIIGVIRDMVVQSPYDPVKPTLFRLGGNPNSIYIRIDSHVSPHYAIGKIADVFKEVISSTPFVYQWADDDYAKKFATEERTGEVASLSAALAVFISLLGLFGMALFVAEQRTREISIRKVLGASVFRLWWLLAKEFVTLVLLSIVVAWVAAYYFMHGWLQQYSYRATFSWWIFASAGIGILLIALLSISHQSLKAAFLNPVRNLRSE